MQKRIQKWKRFLAIFLMGAMLLTNDYGVVQAIADTAQEGENQVKTNIELNAKVLVNNDDGVVDTGEKFQYQLQYTVPNLETGAGKYTGAMLKFTLPEYVHLVKDTNGKYVINGADYQKIEYNEYTKQYTIYFTDPLPMHATNTLTMDMMTENLITPDDLVLDFNEEFYFQTQFQDAKGQSQSMEQAVKAGTITTNAESTWEITKENTTSIDGYNYKKVGTGANAEFEVTYRVKVEDTEGRDRLGRLGFESYQVTDKLPTNLPVGGEAKAIKDVKLVRSTGKVDTAYSVTNDGAGHPIEITFTEYDVIKEGDTFGAGETSQYLKAGDTTNTTYEYTVVYPFAPYTTSGDNPQIITHTLTNTAELNYKLVGEEAAKDTDDAQVNIGAYEDNVVKADVSVAKYVQFKGGKLELLDTATATKYNFNGDNAVKFTLYTDADCTNVAYNTNRQLAQNVAVDENGIATFEDIRKGTYYIKEVSTHNGWTTAAVIQVVVNEDGTVAYPEGKSAYTAINIADTINAVEFTKTGTDAYGTIDSNLAGATFTLTSGSNTYTATSDATGRVRFDNIPDGTYTLAETEISEELINKGYTVSSVTYEVEVKGGVVVTPELGGNYTYENISTKGLLEIKKVDAQNNEIKLSGAVFEVYGPYETQEAATADMNSPDAVKAATLTTKGSNGSITSEPLQKGFYVLIETKAPTNYTSGLPMVVEVEEQKTVSITAENDPQAKIYIRKQGKENANSDNATELAGVEFEIFDADGNQLYGKMNSEGDYEDVSTDPSGREKVKIVTKLDGTGISTSNFMTLSPGNYQYKEIKVPAPYTATNTLVSFRVEDVAPTAEGGAWNVSQTLTVYNYLGYGQIQLQKFEAKADGTKSETTIDGAVFGIYSDLDCKTEVTTVTTADGGNALSGYLAPGTYFVKEKSAPEQYVLSDTVYTVEVRNNEITSMAKKADGTDADLMEIVNGKKGQIQLKKFEANEDGTKSGTAIDNVVFGIYSDENCTEEKDTITTENGGIGLSGYLVPGTYYVQEKSVPNGYIKADTKYIVEVTAGQITETAKKVDGTEITPFEIVNDKKGKIQLEKYEADANGNKSNTPIDGVVFGIYSDENCTEEKDTITTANGGIGLSGYLTPGTYYVKEKSVPSSDYILSNTIYQVEVKKNQTTIKATVNGEEADLRSIVNDKKGQFQVTKIDSVDNTPISGVTFGIYDNAACSTECNAVNCQEPQPLPWYNGGESD